MVPISLAQNSPNDYVAAHNKVRAAVGVGPVSWSATLAAYAQKQVNSRIDTCALADSNGPYGENSAVGDANFSGVDAVNSWAAEQAHYVYNYNDCPYGNVCKHYTQIVWSDSKEIGCASAKCKNGKTYVSCNYNPRGNIAGQFPYLH